MTQYNFIEKNGDAVLTFGADGEKDAIKRAKGILKTLNGWTWEEAM